MKRCPQCEFIYEDDQSLCDMDGVLLVLDSRTLPNLHALTTVAAKATPKRNRTVPAFATLILALVLGMVYYVSTQRNAARNTYSPASTTSSAPVVNPAPESLPPATNEPTPAAEAITPSSTTKDEAKPAATKSPTAAPIKKSTAKTTSQPKTPTEEKKDDSKVGAILKKTGRILKKPFKF